MTISEAAKTIGRMVCEFSNEIQPDCIVGECPRANECNDGFCVIGVERVDNVLRDAISEATAEKDAEIARLRGIASQLVHLAKHDYPHFEDKCRACKLKQALAGGEE